MTDRERLEQAEQWVIDHREELRQQYPGEWIAVMDSQVLGHNIDPAALSNYLAEFDNSFTYWEFIHTQEEINLWSNIWKAFPK